MSDKCVMPRRLQVTEPQRRVLNDIVEGQVSVSEPRDLGGRKIDATMAVLERKGLVERDLGPDENGEPRDEWALTLLGSKLRNDDLI